MMEIRKATKKDLKNITEIFVEECKRPPYNEKWNYNQGYKRINGYFKGGSKILVANINKEIAGFIIFNKGVWWFGERRFVDELYISKKFQGQGIGKTLMKEVEKDFKKSKGINQIYLLTDNRTRAFNFYKNLGYKATPWVLVKKEWK